MCTACAEPCSTCFYSSSSTDIDLTHAHLQALDPVLQELHAVSNWEALSPSAGMIAEQVLKPLFALLQQAANTSSHGQILNRGTLKGQCSALQAPQLVDRLLIAS